MEIIAVPVGAGKTLTSPILVTISENLLIRRSHSVQHKPLIIHINRVVTTGDFYHSKELDLGSEKAAQSSVSHDVLIQPGLMG